MDCLEVRRNLRAFVTGELRPDAWAEASGHLHDCPGCREALRRIDGLAGLLAECADPPAPADLARNVMAAARRQAPAVGAGNWSPRRWWREAPIVLRWATLGVGVVGLALGVVVGTATLPVSGATAGVPVDPLESHAVDYLEDAPDGSLARSYLTLLQDAGEER